MSNPKYSRKELKKQAKYLKFMVEVARGITPEESEERFVAWASQIIQKPFLGLERAQISDADAETLFAAISQHVETLQKKQLC